LSDHRQDNDETRMVEVPTAELSADALRGLVEAFVLREGTDYGEQVASHETKMMQVMRQLERGTAKIVFDPVTETADIVPSEVPGRIGPG
jgi:uncharacterized protein YheU (UPF0270 family)